VDYTPYEGMKFKAWPKTVLSRGKIIIDNGVMTANKDHGKFLKSELPLPAKTFDKSSLIERIEKLTF